MSPREFETAKQYLIQAKHEALRAIALLQAAATTWSDYDLSLEEEAQLHQQLKLDLQEINNAINQELSPSRDFSLPEVTAAPPEKPKSPSRGFQVKTPPGKGKPKLTESAISAEIPPFDPDEY